MYPEVQYEEGVACLILDNPPLNTLDLDIILALEKRFKDLQKKTPLVITGNGTAFCAGVNVKAFAGYRNSQKQEMILAITRMTSALLSIDAPVVAAINGHSMGGGFVLPLCADYRISIDCDSIKHGLTEAEAGIPFPIGPVEIVKHELSPALTRQLTLSSRIVTSRKLLEHSVLDELATAEDLQKVSVERALELSEQPVFSIVKQQIRGKLRANLLAHVKKKQDPLIAYLGL